MKHPNQKTDSLKREIKALKAQLRHAKRENRQLKQILKSSYHSPPPVSPHETICTAGVKAMETFAVATYGQYLWSWLKDTSLWHLASKISKFFRRLRVVRLISYSIWIVLTILLTWAAFLASLPFLFLFGLLTWVVVTLRAGRVNAKLYAKLQGKHILVLLPQEHTALNQQCFWGACAKDMATHPQTAVFVVSPYTLSTKGLEKRSFYFTARQEGENLYIVRKSYYFILKRKVLLSIDPHMTIMC